MPQKITVSAGDLVTSAKAAIKEYTVEEVQAKAGDANVVLVDIRDPRELAREGRMPGAFHCPRGMLEFWICPDSPYHKSVKQCVYCNRSKHQTSPLIQKQPLS